MKLIILFAFTLFTSLLISGQTGQDNSTKPAVKQDEGQRSSVEAVRLFNAGKFDEALPFAKEAITAREKTVGKDHLSVAAAWRNLAYIENKLNKPKEAEDAFDNALSIYEKNQPLSKADEAMFVEMLEAAAYFDIGDGTVSKSASRLTRAIAIREKINGVDAPETARPVITLGQIYHARGEYGKAAPLLLRGLEIQSKNDVFSGDESMMLRETAVCSLIKLDRKEEADDLSKNYRSSTMGAPNTPNDNTIMGGVVNGKALVLAKPAYPAEARSKRASGAVAVKVIIDEAGKVIFACGINGSKLLHLASENAAYRSKFSPTFSGMPVKVSGVITYNFVP